MKIFSLLGFLFLIFGFMISWFTFGDIVPFWTHSEPEILRVLWKQDLENMLAAGKLPEGWFQIKTVEVAKSNWPYTPNHLIAQTLLPTIQTRAEGTMKARIFLDYWETGDTHKHGAYTQIQLVNLQTGNTVWELNRSYELTK